MNSNNLAFCGSLEDERTPPEKLLGSAHEGINIASMARGHKKNEGKSVSSKKESVNLTILTNTLDMLVRNGRQTANIGRVSNHVY